MIIGSGSKRNWMADPVFQRAHLRGKGAVTAAAVGAPWTRQERIRRPGLPFVA
jgi:hypothetical protein